LAVAGGNTYEEKVTIARATIGAKGSAITGRLRIEAPVDTAYPVVQKFTGTDGVESKRVSTNESTWGSWRKVFDEVDKPNIATDVTGAGTAATKNIGTTGNVVPTLDGDNAWSGVNGWTGKSILAGPNFFGGHQPTGIVSGSITPLYTVVTAAAESGTADDLTTIVNANVYENRLLVLRPASGHTITVKNGTGNIHCGADITLNNQYDCLLLLDMGSLGATSWVALAPVANNG
jgi:hypothetical protein